jgi:hypothetical protein
MDLDAFFPAPAVASPISVAPIAGPKILQLFPFPGNYFKMDHFYYSPFTDISLGDLTALLAYATEYGHTFDVHDCPDLAAFQAAYPMAKVHPILEVSVALLQ